MVPYRPNRVLVQEQAWGDSATHEILKRLPGIEIATISDLDVQCSDPTPAHTPRSYARDTLILTHYPGQFLKRCQGSGAEICCNYYVASFAWNCHLECTYCVLQSYLSNEALVICTNIEGLVQDVKNALEQSPDRVFRIGTGELADSLALDHLTCYSRRLVSFFSSLPNGILELKTKSDQVSNLQDLEHRGHTVVSWSMNSKEICRTEERKAASFEERLAAAVRCRQWGYRLGFHFDPIICYEGWEDGYHEAVKEIFSAIDPGSIAWVSLGALRFPPHLRRLVQARFPESRAPSGEFVPGHHGKDRYFRPIREQMYRNMLSWIRAEAPGVLVYLCMENRAVWEQSFGRVPRDTLDLSNQLDSCVFPA